MAVIYEVDLEVDRIIEAEFRCWLQAHVAEILALPGFVAARHFERQDPPSAAGRVAIIVQYELQDRAALDAYFSQHAARLRADGMARFGGRFEARRRILLAVD